MSAFLDELFGLRGKTAVITGAAKGIGASIAKHFALAGAQVVVADVDVDGVGGLAAQIEREGGRAIGVTCDVARIADIDVAIRQSVKAFGRIDVLVNNAGIFPPRAMLELDEGTWERVMGVNLRGAFFFAQKVARQMIEQRSGGSIVNISSIDALHPSGSLAHYDASKGGLQMLTRSLALELGRSGIRVNAIAPGGIHTPGASVAMGALAPGVDAEQFARAFTARIPLQRMGDPADIASVALFLASRAANYITGSTIVVDGGYLLS